MYSLSNSQTRPSNVDAVNLRRGEGGDPLILSVIGLGEDAGSCEEREWPALLGAVTPRAER